MAVRPITLHPDGSIDAVYDEQGHSGTIPADEVAWVKNHDGTDNHLAIVLTCPDGCGATSTHPVGGGAAPLEVQQMFVLKEHSEMTAGGATRSAKTVNDAAQIVKERVIAMDGEERWLLDDAALEALEAKATGA
jgi:hypothetical protein